MENGQHRIELKREAIYRQVWESPLPSVAAALHITMDTLKRVCGLLEVPLPKSGHWRRVTRPRTKSLPRRTKGEAESIWIHLKRDKWVIDPSQFMSQAAVHKQAVKIDGPHALVKRATKYYENPALAASGLMKARSNSAPSLPVSVELKARALTFVDLLLKRLDREGYDLKWRGAMQVGIEESVLRLSVYEETVQVDRPPTPEEAARDKRHFYFEPRIYHGNKPTGRLCVSIVGYREWKDAPKIPVEKHLEEIARALPVCLQERKEAIRLEIERHRLWQEEMRRLDEKHRAERLERSRQERLEVELTAWEKALSIRRLVDALVAAHTDGGDEVADMEFCEWIAWLRRRADLLDPTRRV